MQSILIIGLGHFGYSLVNELARKKMDLIVIEEEQSKAELVKELVDQIIIANAANKELLAKVAKNVDCAIVCLGQKIDSSVLITHYLKSMGIKRVIAKATTRDHGEILKSIGADEIIFPEEETARRMARNLIAPDILDTIKFSDEFDIIEISAPDKFVNQTIKGLDLRNRFEIDILAIRNPLTGKTKIMPSPDYMFKPDDVIIFIGDSGSSAKIREMG